MKSKCSNCRFWEPGSSKIDETVCGECRYNPSVFQPAVDTSAGGSMYGFWPKISGGSWCGKFDPKTSGGFGDL